LYIGYIYKFKYCKYGYLFFFFQAEDGIRDFHVTGVQTCALPISSSEGRETKSKAEAYYSRTVAVPAEEGGKPIVEEIYLSTNKPKLRGTYQRKGSYKYVDEESEVFENGLLKKKENYTKNCTIVESALYLHVN